MRDISPVEAEAVKLLDEPGLMRLSSRTDFVATRVRMAAQCLVQASLRFTTPADVPTDLTDALRSATRALAKYVR